MAPDGVASPRPTERAGPGWEAACSLSAELAGSGWVWGGPAESEHLALPGAQPEDDVDAAGLPRLALGVSEAVCWSSVVKGVTSGAAHRLAPRAAAREAAEGSSRTCRLLCQCVAQVEACGVETRPVPDLTPLPEPCDALSLGAFPASTQPCPFSPARDAVLSPVVP